MVEQLRYQTYQELANDVIPRFNRYLSDRLINEPVSVSLAKSMAYSVNAGGKRLRPLLFFAILATYGIDITGRSFPVAGAIELIHTYSLIHDDLPAMDNDDLRRGKPTNHVVFGEAIAILAGDALQSSAFNWLADADYDDDIKIRLVKILSEAAGSTGMVAGQVADIQSADNEMDISAIAQLQTLKTGKLIRGSVAMGSLIAEVTQSDYSCLANFATCFGQAFQMEDDIFDLTKSAIELGKTPGKDLAEGKKTFADVEGLKAAEIRLKKKIRDANDHLKDLSMDTTLLKSFLSYFEIEKTK